MKYEVFRYDVWGNANDGYTVNDIQATGKLICTDASKASLSEKLGLDDPYKIDVDATNEGVVFVDYEDKPYCELREVVDDVE